MSIENKIFRLTLASVLVSLIALGTIALGSIMYLRGNTVSVYSELADTVSNDSMETLADIAGNDAEKLILKRAELADEKLQTWRTAAIILANSAEHIVQNPQYYRPQPLDDKRVWAWYSKNADIPSLQEEVGLLGNVQGPLRGINEQNANTNVAYVGTESGLYITPSRPANYKETFEAKERPWYIAATNAGGVAWTDIYLDAFGFGLAVTCSAPFYDNDDNLVGVVGVDVFLKDLDWIVRDGKSWGSERSFILDEHGATIVSSALPGEVPMDNLWDFLSSDVDYENITYDIRNSATGFNMLEHTAMDGSKKQWLIVYTTLETLPWRIVTLIDLDEIYQPATAMRGNISAMTERSVDYIGNVILVVIVIFIALSIATAFIIGLLSRRFAHSLTIPIKALRESVNTIAQGDLSHRVAVSYGDEIGELGESVNKMAHDLSTHIHNLQTVTAEKERIGAELNVATQIQSSMLPCIFPAFPSRAEFDIYASMQPAKEVGGDFYDFFLVDEKTLAIVMADVSGKGIPAALFMVIAKTLIKNNAQYGKEPKEVFEIVNDLLCENNEAGMFVTAILGYLDIPSGKFTFVNAGHNPPLHRANKQFDWLKMKAGFVLAGMEDMLYTQHEITLKPGDELFLYTDGVTEAVNRENELFSDPKLLEVANRYLDRPLNEFTISIKTEIDRFANGAEQADDITMLALRYKGNQPSA